MKSLEIIKLIAGILSTVIFLVWMFRRRAKRRAEFAEKSGATGSYTTTQVLGIIGILVFIFPIFLSVMCYLGKGALLLFFFLLAFFPLPELIRSLVTGVFVCAVYIMIYSGTYILCEYIWPKRVPSEDKDLV